MKHKLSKEQVVALISTIIYELQTVFEATTPLKRDKESLKLKKQALDTLTKILKHNGVSLGKDSTSYSITE